MRWTIQNILSTRVKCDLLTWKTDAAADDFARARTGHAVKVKYKTNTTGVILPNSVIYSFTVLNFGGNSYWWYLCQIMILTYASARQWTLLFESRIKIQTVFIYIHSEPYPISCRHISSVASSFIWSHVFVYHFPLTVRHALAAKWTIIKWVEHYGCCFKILRSLTLDPGGTDGNDDPKYTLYIIFITRMPVYGLDVRDIHLDRSSS